MVHNDQSLHVCRHFVEGALHWLNTGGLGVVILRLYKCHHLPALSNRVLLLWTVGSLLSVHITIFPDFLRPMNVEQRGRLSTVYMYQSLHVPKGNLAVC